MADGNHDMKYDKYGGLSRVEFDRIPAYLQPSRRLPLPRSSFGSISGHLGISSDRTESWHHVHNIKPSVVLLF